MDRRRFLQSLFAAAAAAAVAAPILDEVSRVSRIYSFPSNIVIAKPECWVPVFSTVLEAGTYYDFCSWSDITLHTAIDPIVAGQVADLARRAADLTGTSVEQARRFVTFDRSVLDSPRTI
jgi:hypothetical protein